MNTLWLDTETFSELDLKTAGTARYAAHPSTEIMVAQWALNDEEPRVIDCTRPGYAMVHDQDALVAYLQNPSITIVAHNAFFDRTMVREIWQIDVPIERWRCTMAQALAHGLPGSLGQIGEVLGVAEDKAKSKRGRDLINLFCKPRPKNHKIRRATRETHPDEWEEFLQYSHQDIIAMREIAGRMPSWNYKPGGREEALWHLDQRINDRGIAVDTELATCAVRASKREKARLKSEMSDATGGAVSSPSKRDVLLKHILEEHGVELPDMAADTLRRRAEDPELPEAVRTLISIRLEDSKASVSKYTALLQSVSDDGRLRGTQQFCGASRTGRWAHRRFQPGNMKRPDMPAAEIVEAIELLKHDCADFFIQDVMNACANAVRGCLVAPPGRKLVVSDLSNIEGRGVAFLAGEQWKLQAFRDFDNKVGEDLYKIAYGRSFNVDPSEATGKKRQIGKVQELMLGYEGGVGAYLTGAATYGIDLDELADAVHSSAPKEALAQAYKMHEWFTSRRMSTHGLEQSVWVALECLVLQWRAAHQATKALWKACQDAFVMAVASPGRAVSAGDHLVFRVDGSWLRVRLPSGRYLCYLKPQVKMKKDRQVLSYLGINQYTRQWGRISTYGGKTVENATQAWARDVMAWNMPEIDEAGYEILLTVHDELVTEAPDTPDFNAKDLASRMVRNIPWAAGVPLAAAGHDMYRYAKVD